MRKTRAKLAKRTNNRKTMSRKSAGKSVQKNTIFAGEKVQKNAIFAGETPATPASKSKIVKTFMEMINTVKLYHWKTLSYAQHKATDELHEHMQSNVDKFVEILLGKDESRLGMINKRIDNSLTVKIDSSAPKSQDEFQQKLMKYRRFLTSLDSLFDEKEDSDLLNIRDELLADLNQFLYLFALK